MFSWLSHVILMRGNSFVLETLETQAPIHLVVLTVYFTGACRSTFQYDYSEAFVIP